MAVGVDAHRAQRPALLGQQPLQRVLRQGLAIEQAKPLSTPPMRLPRPPANSTAVTSNSVSEATETGVEGMAQG